MLVFDQLRKDDPQLRLLAAVVLGGVLVLLAGLWWVQVVSTTKYQERLEHQSLRTVRIPPVRGKILDREGRPLAENSPQYNIDLYLEELSPSFQTAYQETTNRARQVLAQQAAAKKHELGRALTPQESKQFALTQPLKDQLASQTRYLVTSNIVADLSTRLQLPLTLTYTNFEKHYSKSRVLPLPILTSLTPTQMALFEEQSLHTPAMDLDVQSVRNYPTANNHYPPLAAHILGYIGQDEGKNDDDSGQIYSYRLENYVGKSGIEKLFDDDLRGTAGEKSVVINYLGYRQGESLWTPAEPGRNVVLTIDEDIQRAAERALREQMADVRGAVVVMDARNGDVLAMASAPTYDPGHFARHPDPEPWDDARWRDPEVGIERNRAMMENYHPGSIFKIVVGMAALEIGAIDPDEIYQSLGEYPIPGRSPIKDPAGSGAFNFKRALAKSSNCYFINAGLKKGVLPKVVELGQRLHLGEKTGLIPRQETPGLFPNQKRISSHWYMSDTAYISFGQGEINVTPLQMAVMTSAVANGGKVFYPRLVSSVESPDDITPPEKFPQGRLRDTLGVSEHTLNIVREAMREDVASDEGTGHSAAVADFDIAGKTGTAEVTGQNGQKDKNEKNTWFVSFAPYQNPRYVVVVTVEGGASGGLSCAPIAHKIYLEIQAKELSSARLAASAPLPPK